MMTLATINLLDIITTLYAISMGAVEINPLLATVVVHPVLLITIKLAAIPLCLWLRNKQSYWFVTAVYGVVVANNLIVCFLMKNA